MKKTALITGITGQDGSYLAELLLSKSYEVHGLVRRTTTFSTETGHHLAGLHDENLHLHQGDLTDGGRVRDLVSGIRPAEIYHLAAQSHVGMSFDMPAHTAEVTGVGTAQLLEAVRRTGVPVKFYQASSSEMFGAAPPPQDEATPFEPRSPYAAAKVFAYWLTKNYRDGYGQFACNGILFNHESPRRGETFVTRKITSSLARILSSDQEELRLGNLDAKRDWGFAPEYVECQWRMLQQEEPCDYVIGTGDSRSVREFVDAAFRYAGIELEWVGEGVDERGVVSSADTRSCPRGDIATGDVLVRVDPEFFRPTEVNYLLANASEARRKLGWEPRVGFETLVTIMVDADLERRGIDIKGEGFDALEGCGLSWTRRGISQSTAVPAGESLRGAT